MQNWVITTNGIGGYDTVNGQLVPFYENKSFATNYGQTTVKTHAGEHIAGGNSEPFATESEASEVFQRSVELYQSYNNTSVARVKTPKLLNYD